MCVLSKRGGLGFHDRGGDWGFFCMKDLLGRLGRAWSGIRLGSAVPGVMASLPASEAPSFPHAFCTFLGEKFLESDDVDFHGVWVRRSSSRGGVWGSEVGGSGSSSDLVNA